MITSARRSRNVIGEAARVLLTQNGQTLPLPAATAHGTGAWAAENASFSTSDDTFAR